MGQVIIVDNHGTRKNCLFSQNARTGNGKFYFEFSAFLRAERYNFFVGAMVVPFMAGRFPCFLVLVVVVPFVPCRFTCFFMLVVVMPFVPCRFTCFFMLVVIVTFVLWYCCLCIVCAVLLAFLAGCSTCLLGNNRLACNNNTRQDQDFPE